MGMSLLPILIHSDAVPDEARAALIAASTAPALERDEALESAARVLYRQTNLDCADVRDLLGLTAGVCREA
jgi:hypothetical protein